MKAKSYGLDHGAFCPLKVTGVNLPTVPISIHNVRTRNACDGDEQSAKWSRKAANA